MEGSRVYVVLGATGGIGSVVCRDLRRQGAELVLAARDRQRLDALAAELGGAHVESLDAADVEAVDALVGAAAARHGRVDGLVNCAGSILLRAAHATRPEEWRETIRANLDTAFAAVRAGARAMRSSGGSIVLMAYPSLRNRRSLQGVVVQARQV